MIKVCVKGKGGGGGFGMKSHRSKLCCCLFGEGMCSYLIYMYSYVKYNK